MGAGLCPWARFRHFEGPIWQTEARPKPHDALLHSSHARRNAVETEIKKLHTSGGMPLAEAPEGDQAAAASAAAGNATTHAAAAAAASASAAHAADPTVAPVGAGGRTMGAAPAAAAAAAAEEAGILANYRLEVLRLSEDGSAAYEVVWPKQDSGKNGTTSNGPGGTGATNGASHHGSDGGASAHHHRTIAYLEGELSSGLHLARARPSHHASHRTPPPAEYRLLRTTGGCLGGHHELPPAANTPRAVRSRGIIKRFTFDITPKVGRKLKKKEVASHHAWHEQQQQQQQQQQQLAEQQHAGGTAAAMAMAPRDPNEPLTRPVDDWIDATWPRCIASCLKVHLRPCA